MPLALVTRLEEIEVVSDREADGRSVIHYRGTLMPLVSVDNGTPRRRAAPAPMLVFTDGGRAMGLVVDEILDIVEEPCPSRFPRSRPPARSALP